MASQSSSGTADIDRAGTSGAGLSPLRRASILVSVILATTLYGTTLLVVSTILPQMQGSFSATSDEIAWSMTFNILATAIVTPMTGWLAARFGQRGTMVWCMAGFTLATFMCAIADSLEALIFWRIAQGAFGAPTTPLAQSILLEVVPQVAARIRPVLLRHRRGHRSGHRPEPRRPDGRALHLALGVLLSCAGGCAVRCRPASVAVAGRAPQSHQPRLGRFSGTVNGARRHAARAVARPAAGLARVRTRSSSRSSLLSWRSGCLPCIA